METQRANVEPCLFFKMALSQIDKAALVEMLRCLFQFKSTKNIMKVSKGAASLLTSGGFCLQTVAAGKLPRWIWHKLTSGTV